MKRRRKAPRRREPICTECSHGERARAIEDPATLHPPAARLERYLTTEWQWWLCGHCDAVWVVRRALKPGIEKRRIGFLDDATGAWHDVSG